MEIGFDAHAEKLAERQYLQPGDGNILGMFRRVARAIAQAESPEQRSAWEERFYNLMASKRFSPGGRILAGAGTAHGNLLNCFVQGATDHEPNSFVGIMEVAKKLALVTRVGGGNGVNLDPYRKTATPTRRPVLGFAYMRADHPDVQDFVLCRMRPSNNPDGEKVVQPVQGWVRVVWGEISPELERLAREQGVQTVHQPPTDLIRLEDDMGAIMDGLAQAMTLARGGAAPHVDFSGLRPEGSPVRGSGGTSSGPVSFLIELFDNFLRWVNLGAEGSGPVATLRYIYAPVLRSIKQGGVRRGAGMATLSVDHPDLLDFITAKDLDREGAEGDISSFNISVLATTEFLKAVEEDALWSAPQAVPGKYTPEPLEGPYRGEWPDQASLNPSARAIPLWGGQTSARWLFREIAQHAWSTGEPGIIFIDRVNQLSALKGLGEKYQIRSTNPCLTGETLVLTSQGEVPISELARRSAEGAELLVFAYDFDSNGWVLTRATAFKTRDRANVVEIRYRDSQGEIHTLRATPDHLIWTQDAGWVPAGHLEPNQRLLPAANHLLDQPVGANHTVVAVTPLSERQAVYDLHVPGYANFLAGSAGHPVVVHNCGEIPLTVGEPCDLGALNLEAYVREGRFDLEAFHEDIPVAVRFLDNVLEVNRFALPDNQEASRRLRRLGLGVMGLADMLIRLDLPYGSEAARETVGQVMSVLREETIRASEALAEERGPFPLYLEHPDHFRSLGISPRRNVALLTVAPTGTTSMIMGVSSGIEPVFAPFIWRRIGGEYKALIHPLFAELLEQYPATGPFAAAEGGWDWERVVEAIQANHGSVQGLEGIPEGIQRAFQCAHDIPPLDHVRMQGVIQRAFDAAGYAGNSLSKTINLPNPATVEEVLEAYWEAYKSGCKGITVYRDGSRQFQVLTVKKEKEKVKEENPQPPVTQPQPAPVATQVLERPGRLHGFTDMIKLFDRDGTRHSYLVTVNSTSQSQPVEVILTTGRAGDEANADSEALGRVVSIALQHGVPVEALVRTLRGINGGLYGTYNGGLVASKADLIAVALESVGEARSLPAQVGERPRVLASTAPGLEVCPSCKERALVREEGCRKCQACGWSKCG